MLAHVNDLFLLTLSGAALPGAKLLRVFSTPIMLNKLHLGDNLEILDSLPDNSIDAIITDSPYGLGKEPDAVKCLQDWIDHGYHDIKGKGFMGKHWDAFVPQPILWKKCFRVLKPGGHLLSFFGTRTYDWGTLAIRLAGFEIRDCIMWVYGSGFPKSLDISKAIDKAAGELNIVSELPAFGIGGKETFNGHKQGATYKITEPVTDEAKQWSGYGTALKPACEPICVARKPLIGSVVENVLQYGTGGINIDAGRIETDEITGWQGSPGFTKTVLNGGSDNAQDPRPSTGRWPANIVHDGSDEVLDLFPYTKSGGKKPTDNRKKGYGESITKTGWGYKAIEYDFTTSEGTAARFFYCAKTSPAERAGRKHPTIKPLALMEYLVKVFCPKGGVCLDPFAGTGTTLVAAANVGCSYIGIEQDESSYNEAKQFINDSLFDGL